MTGPSDSLEGQQLTDHSVRLRDVLVYLRGSDSDDHEYEMWRRSIADDIEREFSVANNETQTAPCGGAGPDRSGDVERVFDLLAEWKLECLRLRAALDSLRGHVQAPEGARIIHDALAPRGEERD